MINVGPDKQSVCLVLVGPHMSVLLAVAARSEPAGPEQLQMAVLSRAPGRGLLAARGWPPCSSGVPHSPEPAPDCPDTAEAVYTLTYGKCQSRRPRGRTDVSS